MKQYRDYALALCEITYKLPDHPSLVNLMYWQTLDLAPDFPRVRKYLDYWEKNIEGPLVGVRIAHTSLIRPTDFRFTEGRLILQ